TGQIAGYYDQIKGLVAQNLRHARNRRLIFIAEVNVGKVRQAPDHVASPSAGASTRATTGRKRTTVDLFRRTSSPSRMAGIRRGALIRVFWLRQTSTPGA